MCVQDVMVVGEPSLMGGEFGEEDERLVSQYIIIIHTIITIVIPSNNNQQVDLPARELPVRPGWARAPWPAPR